MAILWFYTQSGQKAADPISFSELQDLAARGQLQPSDLLWREGLEQWTQANQIRGLFVDNLSAQMPLPPGPGAYGPQSRSRWEEDRFDDRPLRRRPTPPKGKNIWGILGGVLGGLLLIGSIVVGVLTGIFGENETKKALAFNEKIVKGDQRLVQAVKDFETACLPWRNGVQPDMTLVKNTFQKWKQEMDAAQAELPSFYVPNKTSAKALFEEYKNYLKACRTNMEDNGKVIDTLDDAKLTLVDKQIRCANLAGQVQTSFNGTQEAGNRLKNAQKTFAKDYNLTLIFPPSQIPPQVPVPPPQVMPK